MMKNTVRIFAVYSIFAMASAGANLGCGDDESSGDPLGMPGTTSGDGDSDGTSSGPSGSEASSDDTSNTTGGSAADDDGSTSSADDTGPTDAGDDGLTDGLVCEGPLPTCGSTALAHCSLADVGACFEYYDDCVLVPEAPGECEDFGGVWGEGGCPSTDLYGICLDAGLVQTGLASYDFGGVTYEQAQEGCEEAGAEWCPA